MSQPTTPSPQAVSQILESFQDTLACADDAVKLAADLQASNDRLVAERDTLRQQLHDAQLRLQKQAQDQQTVTLHKVAAANQVSELVEFLVLRGVEADTPETRKKMAGFLDGSSAETLGVIRRVVDQHVRPVAPAQLGRPLNRTSTATQHKEPERHKSARQLLDEEWREVLETGTLS